MEEYTVYRKGFIGREGLDSEQKEERVKASKMYSKILES